MRFPNNFEKLKKKVKKQFLLDYLGHSEKILFI